jgi:hypothetical protein
VSAGLEADLRAAMEDAIVGEPMSAMLEGRLKTVARAVLLRHRLGAARVLVRREGAGFRVRVDLPPGAARVTSIHLRLG